MSEAVTDVEGRLEAAREALQALRSEVRRSFLGQRDALEVTLYAIVADGHVLLEGAPGLGKTTLVRSLARALDLAFGRIQFTPDLMPGDVLGTRFLEQSPDGARSFVLQRGPVFCNLLLADEINRATPRTQSALLEAMQERQVSLFGETLALERPFLVIATQNPIEMEGTYPLPEAQLDRFLAKVELARPGERELRDILAATTGAPPADAPPCLSRERLLELQALVRDVPDSDEVRAAVTRTVLRTHPSEPSAPDEVRRLVRYGASPRGAQALLLLARARALLRGRLHVAIEDVEAVLGPALRHRLILNYEGEASGVHPDELVRAAWDAGRR